MAMLLAAALSLVCTVPAAHVTGSLEHFPTNLGHLDGADFGSVQEEKAQQYVDITRLFDAAMGQKRPAPKGLGRAGRWRGAARGFPAQSRRVNVMSSGSNADGRGSDLIRALSQPLPPYADAPGIFCDGFEGRALRLA